ncbi:MAG: hypothetical protein KAT68_00450 [Bacteroidales bacterium]|nr:hypothetical protein [Bacteroidales bacterium]
MKKLKIPSMKQVIKFIAILISLILIRTNVYSTDRLNNTYTKVDSISKQVEYKSMQFKIGYNLGWEFPYSAGIEFSCLFNEIIDVNIGSGLGISGAKIGLGTRFYPVKNKKRSPIIGIYLYHATGKKSLNIGLDETEYKITPDVALLINTGIRFRLRKGHYLITGIGYSIPFRGKKAEYKWGATDNSTQSFANALSTGGFSTNIGILIKL